jgi:hypothetical protein
MCCKGASPSFRCWEYLPALTGSGTRLCSEQAAIESVKIDTRQFAKRQRTWLRRLPELQSTGTLDAASAVAAAAAAAPGWVSLLPVAAAAHLRPELVGTDARTTVMAARVLDWTAMLLRDAMAVIAKADTVSLP